MRHGGLNAAVQLVTRTPSAVGNPARRTASPRNPDIRFPKPRRNARMALAVEMGADQPERASRTGSAIATSIRRPSSSHGRGTKAVPTRESLGGESPGTIKPWRCLGHIWIGRAELSPPNSRSFGNAPGYVCLFVCGPLCHGMAATAVACGARQWLFR